jgi:hypothetical protein
MAKKINKEPVVVEPGATEPPAQPPSEPQAEPSAVDVEAMKEIFGPMIEDAFSRQSQSVKDKRIAKQESRISSLEDTLAQFKELQAEGMSEKQAVQYMRTQEFLDAQGEQVPTDAPPATEPAVPATVAVDDSLSAILNLAGLDANEADVLALLRENKELPERIVAINSLAETRKQAQTNPAAAGNVLPSGTGASVSEETLETTSEQLDAELAKEKKDFEKIKELRKKNLELLPKE